MNTSTFSVESLKDENGVGRYDKHCLHLSEAEIEEKYRPEAISAEESDARMREIFALWGIDYA